MEQWLIEHWRVVTGGGVAGLLLLLWQRGFFGSAVRCVQTLRKAFRDQERADALARCESCEAQLAEVKAALVLRVKTDDARDEIHQQDLAEKKQMTEDKKQMAACIDRLKDRLREHRIPFDDLL